MKGLPDKKYMVKDDKGNLVAFDQIYDTWFEPIFHFILHRVGNVAEAEDLAAQTFFKALKRFWTFRWQSGSISAWLYRIAINETNSWFRKQRATTSLEEGGDNLSGPSQTDAELARAEQNLAQHTIYLDLNKALQNLKADEQTLIVLRYFEQKPFNEIAEIMKKRQGSLVMRTHRALDKLKTELEKRGIDHERIRGSFAEDTETGYQGGGIQARFTT